MQLKAKKIKKETKGIFSLILEKPENFMFYPGQFLDIELPVNDPKGNTRILSISSSPSEDFIMLTFKLTSSPFNKKLQDLKVGDLISSSYPAGTVVIDDSSPIIFMAGGIGIAPHRSMIKWAVDQSRLNRDQKLNLPITLIYSNSDSDFIFKKELDQWVKTYPKLTIHYIVTSKDGRLDSEKLKLYPIPYLRGAEASSAYTLYPIFYLAGPPSMVDDFENILLNLGIDETSIRTDRFDGL
ncbi:MAG: FAD-dependent oxidoreductase [Patescibacteria group bacterium]